MFNFTTRTRPYMITVFLPTLSIALVRCSNCRYVDGMCGNAAFLNEESSQAAKYGGCFAGDSLVHTSTGQQKMISELQIGEQILSLDRFTNSFVYSEVLLFLDWDPLQRREFLKLKTLAGRTLTVTASHLLLTGTVNSSRTIFAENLSVGDSVLVRDTFGRLFEDNIVFIKPVLQTGIFAPLTATGTVVVNDVLASCYAVVDSQSLAHWAFAPLRLSLNMRDSVYRLWKLILEPLSVGSSDSLDLKLYSPSPGVHWYARTLYAIAEQLNIVSYK